MNKANKEIRTLAKSRGVSLEDIAAHLNVEKAVICKWLRKGLPANVKPKIIGFLENNEVQH